MLNLKAQNTTNCMHTVQ